MRARGKLKHFYYSSPLFYRGSFPYYGHDLHFPRGSHLFVRACEEGIYERETVKLVTSLARPGTTCIDVGANLGLISIPVLEETQDVSVLSVEASPDTLKHLRATHAKSRHRDRWTIVGAAAGREPGQAGFWASSPENAAFDGFKDTGRGGSKTSVTVEVQTLDSIWTSAGRPRVTVVKIDVEGAEADVIAGAHALLAEERPALVIEWSQLNLPSYGREPEHLFVVCREIGYRIYGYPMLCEVGRAEILRAAMAQTETFLLLPSQAPS